MPRHQTNESIALSNQNAVHIFSIWLHHSFYVCFAINEIISSICCSGKNLIELPLYGCCSADGFAVSLSLMRKMICKQFIRHKSGQKASTPPLPAFAYQIRHVDPFNFDMPIFLRFERMWNHPFRCFMANTVFFKNKFASTT